VSRRVGVVLFNLGGPDSLEAVKPFLFNLFSDPAIIGLPQPLRGILARRISSGREEEAKANYAHMGGASPLQRETEAQRQALEQALTAQLPNDVVKVVTAMRYWRPFTQDAAAEMTAFAPDELVLLPLYPQFSTTTTGSSLKAWRKAYQGSGREHAVCCYPDEAGLVQAHVERILAVWDAAERPADVRLLFSAHGLPERVVQGGDPYQWQVERTCAAIAARLAGDWPELDWSICYQSRVGPLKWIGPATPDAITAAIDADKGVLLVPVAFVSEHVETLVELDRDYAELAQAKGAKHYLRAPAVGVLPPFIEGLAQTTVTAMTRSATQSACGGRLCPTGHRRCPVAA
jgi:ferrochelatase